MATHKRLRSSRHPGASAYAEQVEYGFILFLNHAASAEIMRNLSQIHEFCLSTHNAVLIKDTNQSAKSASLESEQTFGAFTIQTCTDLRPFSPICR